MINTTSETIISSADSAHVWCVANPVGGGGKGGRLAEALTNLLRRRFPHLVVHMSNVNYQTNSSSSPSCPSLSEPSVPAIPPFLPLSCGGGASCDMYYTRESGDGSRIAQDVISPQIEALLNNRSDSSNNDGDSTVDLGTAHQRQQHFVVVVGGDGTLSEVIDGLCRGILERTTTQSSGANSTSGCCAFSTCTHRRELAQQRLDRLPTIIYLAGGTGADFARLGFCCRTPEEVLTILTASRLEALAGMSSTPPTPDGVDPRGLNPSVVQPPHSIIGGGGGGLTSVPLSSLQDTNHHPSTSNNGNSNSKSRSMKLEPMATFAKVDIGTVTYLNPIVSPVATAGTAEQHQQQQYPQFRHQYFINEVSVGLSSAVVQRAEKLKKSWVSYFGGSAVFLAAGVLELLFLLPRSVRMRQILDVDDPLNRHSSTCVHAPPLPPSSTSSKSNHQHTLHQTSSTSSPSDQLEYWSQGGWVGVETVALVFGNGQYFGGGMKVCPQGNLFDQRLSITSWGESRCGFLFGIPSLYTGRASRSWATSRMFTGQRVVVEMDPMEAVVRGSSSPSLSDGNVVDEFPLMEADGEALSRLPALVETCLSIRFAFLR